MTKDLRKQAIKEISLLFDSPQKINDELNLVFWKTSIYKKLKEEIRVCKRCKGLNIKAVTESASGIGSLNAKIMIVGQSLCTQCMHTGIPFTRGSGDLIDYALVVVGLSRNDVFITNVVHCHPINNRKSTEEEVDNCRDFLNKEIELVGPRIIVTLGKDAKENVLVKDIGKGIRIVNLTHPAYAMRKGKSTSKKWVLDLVEILYEYK
jgi:uracil-DNA glycosylase family 4